MQALGTIPAHIAAGLTDEEARHLEERTRQLYKRILMLMNETGCNYQTAIQAIQDSLKQEHGR